VLSVSNGRYVQTPLAENPEKVLKELVQKSLGELERAVLATPDGVVLAVSNPSDFDDVMAALSAAVVAGVGDAFKQYFLIRVHDVTVELEDERVVIMRDLGVAVLCLITRPRPNLGLVYHQLTKHLDRLLVALDQKHLVQTEELSPLDGNRAQTVAPRVIYKS
jgi:predicted regulator of Ras-like GTPase activity (Roadblock/LC7/MglB family)